METLKSNVKRAQNAMTLVWIVLAFEVAALVSGYLQYYLLQQGLNGGEITQEAADANNLREQIVGFLSAAAQIVSAVTFILWFRRAYNNLDKRISGVSYDENQAAYSWFIPFFNWVRPYQIMKDLYTRTRELLSTQGVTLSTRFLGPWWTLWIVNSIVGQVVFRMTTKAERMDDLSDSTVIGMVSNLIGIPLALVTVRVIRDYAKVEPLLSDALLIDDSDTLDGLPIVKS